MNILKRSPRRLLATILFAGLAVSSFGVSGQTVYFHTDTLGSPVAATDDNGNLLWREHYRPFGSRIDVEQGAGGNRQWFTGKSYDDESGLIYLGARNYDPALGRFMGIDPVGFEEAIPSSFNRYAYVANNPYKYVDPTGEKLRFAPGSTPTFQKQFAEIIQYHNKNRTSALFARLEARPEIIYIEEGTGHAFYYRSSTKTITFDPTSGLEVSPGNVQTPALGVLHEAAHAESDLINPAQHLKDASTPAPGGYDNVEERDAIQNVETPAAIKIGEPTRTNHGGTAVRVGCPTCDK